MRSNSSGGRSTSRMVGVACMITEQRQRQRARRPWPSCSSSSSYRYVTHTPPLQPTALTRALPWLGGALLCCTGCRGSSWAPFGSSIDPPHLSSLLRSSTFPHIPEAELCHPFLLPILFLVGKMMRTRHYSRLVDSNDPPQLPASAYQRTPVSGHGTVEATHVQLLQHASFPGQRHTMVASLRRVSGPRLFWRVGDSH